MIPYLQTFGDCNPSGSRHWIRERAKDGISAIQNRLKVASDGKPRLTVGQSCVNAINELESYQWRPERDEPQKENDHFCDSIRYLHAAMQGGGTGAFSTFPDYATVRLILLAAL